MQSAHEDVKFIRKTIDIHPELVKIIQEMADKKYWSFSYMSYVLLQYAAREKIRKKHTAEGK